MKIIIILLNFSKLELEQIQQFMQSPFFETPEEVKQLYDVIIEPLKANQSSLLNQAYLYKTYQSKHKLKLSKEQFNKLVWKLHQTIEQFHSHLELKKNQWQQKEALLARYADNASPKTYLNLHKRSVKQLHNAPERAEAFQLKSFRLQNDLYFHRDTDKKTKEAGALLAATQAHLDQFYMLAKLRLGIELLTRQQFLNEKHTLYLLEEVMPLAKKQKDPTFDIYIALIKLIQKDSSFTFLKKAIGLFEMHLNRFNKKEQATILQFLLNYTNQRFSKGEAKYLTLQFELYQLAVQKKLLIENNQQMSDTSFTNVIITACLSKAFDYAYHFLQTNKKYLNPSTRKNAVSLSWAYIHFHNKQFGEAWKKILQTEFVTTDYKLRARSLLLRCYYEQLPYDEEIKRTLHYSLQNFKKFIYRLSSISQPVKARYNNQIIVVRALFQFDPAIDKSNVFKTKWLDFIETHPIVAKAWLREKVEQL